MIAEALDDLKGVQFNGINITNFRYADDAVLAAYSKQKLQVMLDKLSETCNNYGMAINVKKTKVMVVSKRGKIKCQVTLDNKTLEQVSRYKYLGSWISDDAKCVEEIRTRIALAKEAFWKNKELLRGNIRPRTKLKILNCYIFSVLNYGCECWTWNKATLNKIDAFEQWCYRRILKISWKDKVKNDEVLDRIQTRMHFKKDMKKRKLEYAGHVLRGSSGRTHLVLLEGKVCGKKSRGKPRLTWMKYITDWTKIDSYGKIKRAAENRDGWRTIAVNLLKEDDT